VIHPRSGRALVSLIPFFLPPDRCFVFLSSNQIWYTRWGTITVSWTDERVALLKKLWGDGRTAAEIARSLGAGFTRNAVIGKAHRLKLSSRMSPISSSMSKAKPANTQRAPIQRLKHAAPPPVKIDVKGIKLIDLKERMCRWPLGDPQDPNFNFCGCNTVPGLPYCADHARMAYQVNKRSRLFNPDDVAQEEVDDDLIKVVMAG
jgi:GcrA cell cycle regulator